MNEEILKEAQKLAKKPLTQISETILGTIIDNIIKDKEIDRLNNIINQIKEYLKYQIENLDFEKDTKAKMLGSMILVMLDKEELKKKND